MAVVNTHSSPTMTTQERINQLAGKALRSGPPPAAAPKPATFMPSFEKMKSSEFVAITSPDVTRSASAVAAPAPAAAPAPVKVAAAAPAPAAVVVAPVDPESEAELRSMIDSRDQKMIKKRSRTSLAITCSLLALLVAGGIYVTVSPTARGKMNSLVTAIKQSGKDVKGLTSMVEGYDKQLDQVAVHGARLDEATKALGADPNAEAGSAQADIDAAMKDMSGGETTSRERDAALKDKFGIVSKVAGRKVEDDRKAESDVKF